MKKPEEVKVGPFTYSIVWDRDRLDGDSGTCHTDRLEIVASPDLPHVRQAEVLTHEILHSAMGLVGLFDGKEDAEEDAVVRLSPVLLQILRDNPAVVKFITY